MESQDAIEDLVVSKMSELRKLVPAAIASDDSVFSLGLDSSGALSLVGHLEDRLGITIDPILIWEFPRISDLAAQRSQASQVRPS